jgi:hypothetical protein
MKLVIAHFWEILTYFIALTTEYSPSTLVSNNLNL